MSKKLGLLERLTKGPVLGAEGYVYELERRGYVKAGPYVPEVVVDFPEALKQLHREFLRAGAEVMVALTYYAHRDKLKDVGREGELEAMNRTAVRIAREIAAEGEALVAGNICNTWAYDPDNHEESAKKVREMYREQLNWAVDEGVDMVIAETLEYKGEALIALEVIKEFDLPAMVTMAPGDERSRDGYDWVEICVELEQNGAEVVGLNCLQGPQTMMPLLKQIRKEVTGYVAAQPVPHRTSDECKHFQYFKDKAGELVQPYNLDPYLLNRSEMAAFAREANELGINYIGICCGAGPHHVRAMAEALGRTVPASKYSPDMGRHKQLGNEEFVDEQHKGFVEKRG